MSGLRYACICALALAGSFGGAFVASRGVAAGAGAGCDGSSRTVFHGNGSKGPDSGGGSGDSGTRRADDQRGEDGRVEISGAGSIAIHNGAGKLVWSAPGVGIIPATD